MQNGETGNLLSGQLIKVLLASAVLAFPIALGLLRLYRLRVQQAMGRRSPAPPPSRPVPATTPPPAAPLNLARSDARRVAEVSPAVAALFEAARAGPWRTAAVYTAAGLLFSAVMTGAFLVGSGVGILPMRFLAVAWAYAWPAVLTVSLVAATTPGLRLLVAAVYFAVLIAIGLIGHARSPDFTVGQMVMLWLVVNALPTALLSLFLARPIRAAGPMVLTFLVVALSGAEIAVSMISGQGGVLRAAAEVGTALHLNAAAVFAGILLGGVAALAPLAWLAGRWLAGAYARKAISDQSVTLDAVWLLFGMEHGVSLISQSSPAWLAAVPIAFAVYTAAARIGFGVAGRQVPAGAPRLLLLRAFSLGRRSERLFDQLATRWRHVGSVQLIAGPDLVTTTVEPHEFLDFLRGRLARRFIDGPEAIERRFAELDLAPDPDGRFRVNEFFCHDDTWRPVLQRLARTSDVVVVDLRGFSRAHAGLAFEIEALVHLVPLPRIVALVDGGTDRPYLAELAEAAWRSLPAGSPNRAAASPALRLFDAAGAGGAPLPLLRAIAAAARADTVPTETLAPAPTAPHVIPPSESHVQPRDSSRGGTVHCRNCGKEVNQQAIACPSCGVPPMRGTKFCNSCGAPTEAAQVMCVKCGVGLGRAGGGGGGGGGGAKSKVAAGLLGIFLGAFGIHKFYLGYTKPAVIMLVVSLVGLVVTFGIATWIVALIGFIEGIIYIVKSDEDFDATYVRAERAWF